MTYPVGWRKGGRANFSLVWWMGVYIYVHIYCLCEQRSINALKRIENFSLQNFDQNISHITLEILWRYYEFWESAQYG